MRTLWNNERVSHTLRKRDNQSSQRKRNVARKKKTTETQILNTNGDKNKVFEALKMNRKPIDTKYMNKSFIIGTWLVPYANQFGEIK